MGATLANFVERVTVGEDGRCWIAAHRFVSEAVSCTMQPTPTIVTVSFSSIPALPQLRRCTSSRRHALVGRVHAGRRDLAAHLHQARDRQRVARRPHHRADAVLLVVAIDELERRACRLAALRARRRSTRSATRSRPFGLRELRAASRRRTRRAARPSTPFTSTGSRSSRPSSRIASMICAWPG